MFERGLMAKEEYMATAEGATKRGHKHKVELN